MNQLSSPLPIGLSFFDKLIENGHYYVDKTLLIKELLDKKAEVNLFTRPRRFGKTLNMRMLQCFFETPAHRSLFNGLKIETADGGRYMEQQGQYPVIFLTLKSAKQPSWELAYESLKKSITDEFERHAYLLQNEQLSTKKEQYERIMLGEGSDSDFNQSLRFLSECLEIHHDKKTIILIDEYDVPLENSWFRGFYDKMIDFIRSLFESALKDNPFLEFAALTGCLRVSKESIFTGLNNPKMVSIQNREYAEHFGFTSQEVETMLHCYGLDSRLEDIRTWYNGYQFGETQIYNPWSLINAVDDLKGHPNIPLLPYWSNTSGNSIVRTLVDKADSEAKNDLGTLVSGGTIRKEIHEDITYNEMENSIDNIWNFLFFTGYLTKTNETVEDGHIILELTIPNRELLYIFENKIQDWFKEKIKQKDFTEFYKAILDGDAQIFENLLADELFGSISFYDNAENFYHGFLTGLLSRLDGYLVKSNRESGNGRGDIFMRYLTTRGKAIVFELKVADTPQKMDAKCEEALAQIEEKKYETEFRNAGYKEILKYGIAFCGKDCRIKKGTARDLPL